MNNGFNKWKALLYYALAGLFMFVVAVSLALIEYWIYINA